MARSVFLARLADWVEDQKQGFSHYLMEQSRGKAISKGVQLLHDQQPDSRILRIRTFVSPLGSSSQSEVRIFKCKEQSANSVGP